MESYLPMGPTIGRRLSRLYNDTKKLSDFVHQAPSAGSTAALEADPEIKALHRKLRIQKDRFTTWGLEWSDPNAPPPGASSTESAEEILIDSSLNRAGLSDLVQSIISTIKDILAEVEPLWQASRRLAGEPPDPGGPPQPPPRRGEKIQLVVWDKARFEDLLRDLTSSVDTLYDLSRTRSTYAQSSAAARERLLKSTSPEDAGGPGAPRPFESSRIQTPLQIDPAALTNLRAMQAEPMTEADSSSSEHPREIVFMSKAAYAQLTNNTSGSSAPGPLLLEYAPVDPIFSATGIMPPMTRFERLAKGLSSEPQRSPGSWTGLPSLLGYFEDMERSRVGLVYQFPPTFNPVTYETLTQNPLYNLCSLADLLARPDFEPTLEAKFRLAANLANTVFDMHARGITHGGVDDRSISFCNAVGTDPATSGSPTGEVDIRRPLVSSFDLFSEPDATAEPSANPYRHPLDPRATPQSPLAAQADSKTFDLYALAMVLLSIGLWTRLENLLPNPTAQGGAVPEAVLEQLAIRCGTLYMKAVQTCWTAVDQEMAGRVTAEQVVARVQVKTSRYLEACCILDGVNKLEERLGDDLGDARPVPQSVQTVAESSKDVEARGARSEAISTPTGQGGSAETLPAPLPSTCISTSAQPPATNTNINTKTRLYPHVPLPPAAVTHWNTVLMPQVNAALRSFYHRHPESVEISLEAIGASAAQTQPTVLVVCTSVAKVRAILRRKLGALLDAAAFALKVCRGQVLRSRKHGGPSRRSMAGDCQDNDADDGDDADDKPVAAANPGFQARPANGASVGAWIGDRHLPPVSLGGVMLVDDRPYGMTVHHMLDDPDATTRGEPYPPSVARSMAPPTLQSGVLPDLAAWYAAQYQQEPDAPASDAGDESSSSGVSSEYACEFSDTESDTSESAITSDASHLSDSDSYNSDDDDDGDGPRYDEPGDIPGVEPGCGAGYIVTQPARDDVPAGFYPAPETADEDHLDTYALGQVYASSGLRRRRDEQGLVHEIDWALFAFAPERAPDNNTIPLASVSTSSPCTSTNKASKRASGKRASSALPPIVEPPPTLHPTLVAPTASLPGLRVQCMARTSGLQTGRILPALTSVKIFGRKSPSHSYQVSSDTTTHTHPHPPPHHTSSSTTTRNLPMGIPGDSGAWLVSLPSSSSSFPCSASGQEEGGDHHPGGQVAGHILAWSARKRVAYLCPMEVLLVDMAETLEAGEIRLPGGAPLISMHQHHQSTQYYHSDPQHDDDDDDDDPDRVSDLSDEDGAAGMLPEAGVSMRGWDGEDASGEMPVPGTYRRSSRRTTTGSQTRSGQQGDMSLGDGHEEYDDEAVEVELANDIRKMRLADRSSGMHSGQWV